MTVEQHQFSLLSPSGEVLGQHVDGQARLHHTDLLGSVRAGVTASGRGSRSSPSGLLS